MNLTSLIVGEGVFTEQDLITLLIVSLIMGILFFMMSFIFKWKYDRLYAILEDDYNLMIKCGVERL